MAESRPDREKEKKSRFKTVSKPKAQEILDERIEPNTQKATKIWMTCLREYLAEKNLPPIENIDSDDLPAILSQFYTELRKKDGEGEYKTSTLKCIRAALNRYFKEKRSLDILSDARFIKTNEMFKGVTRVAKREGRGEVNSRPPIEAEDLQRITTYFTNNLAGPPNAKHLQEIVLFHIIYYMGRRGRQNLRGMQKDTFAIATDASGKRYIYQAKKELDKNHKEDDMSPNNQARVYEDPCKLLSFNFPVIKVNESPKITW